jgi:hypothetical protein
LLEYFLQDGLPEDSVVCSLLSSSSSGSSSPVTMKKKSTRRLSRNPVFMPTLRVLKRDIRRKYNEMWCNTINNHDPSLVAKFFTEFAMPNIRFFFSTAGPDPQAECYALYMEEKKRTKKPELVIGTKDVVSGLVVAFHMTPDLIVRMGRSQVRVREGDSGSVVAADFVMKGTQVFLPYGTGPDGSMYEAGCGPESLTLKWEKMNTPRDFQMAGKTYMVLDEMNRITCLQIKIDFYGLQEISTPF